MHFFTILLLKKYKKNIIWQHFTVIIFIIDLTISLKYELTYTIKLIKIVYIFILNFNNLKKKYWITT